MTRAINSLPENRSHLLEKSRELLGWPLIQEALAVRLNQKPFPKKWSVRRVGKFLMSTSEMHAMLAVRKKRRLDLPTKLKRQEALG